MTNGMTEKEELTWLAGILEGEGSFQLITNHVNGRPYKYPAIVVNMTDSDIIQRVADMFGLSMYSMKKPHGTGSRLPQFKAITTGGKAVVWMKKLLPFMGARRTKRITEILSYWDEKYTGTTPNERRSETLKKTLAEKRKNGEQWPVRNSLNIQNIP